MPGSVIATNKSPAERAKMEAGPTVQERTVGCRTEGDRSPREATSARAVRKNRQRVGKKYAQREAARRHQEAMPPHRESTEHAAALAREPQQGEC